MRFAVDSTSSVLAGRLRAGASTPELCTAELQTAGRGRQGRRWISGLGQSLVLSVSWCFTTRSNALSGLSLAAGVALVEALAADGFGHVMLKWPNDLVVDDRKLAGILVEANHSRPRSATCVIGVGFNLDLAPADSGRIDQPWTDFARAFGRIPARSGLAARTANALLDACEQYGDHGLEPSQPGGASATRCVAGPCACCRGERRSRGWRTESTTTARCSSNVPRASFAAGPAKSGCGRSTPEQDGDAFPPTSARCSPHGKPRGSTTSIACRGFR